MASKVTECHEGIGRSLDINHAGVFADGAFHIFHIGSIDVGEFDAVTGEHLIEEARNSAIKVVAAHDVVAGLEHGANSVDGSHAAGEGAGGDSAFERCEVLLQPSAGGIGNAGVLVSFILAQFLLDVSGRRMDGDGDRAGFGVRLLAGMDGASGETGLSVLGHG